MEDLKIGDTAYLATFTSLATVWVICPECVGSGRLEVTLGTGEKVTIACECCARGYEGSPGKIHTYEPKAAAERVTIKGVEITQSGAEVKTRYRSDGYIYDANRLYATREEAFVRAEQLAESHAQELERRIHQKEKQHKKWAWHVSYHRRQIKYQEKQIEYHKACLAVADKKAHPTPEG